MRIGFDFDNTLVQYDQLFHAMALERDWIDSDVVVSKTAVRDFMRARGDEAKWTWLQGQVYGERIVDAPRAEGVRDCVRAIKAHGHDIFVVSHKTKYPYVGDEIDLHTSALAWLTANELIDGDAGFDRAGIYFEPTKERKLERIGALRCDVFIDDLPEFLAEACFPAMTLPVLFDPNALTRASPKYRRIDKFEQLMRLLEIEVCA